ncbi:bifunctional 3-deoxy-7-phosphoheptulonate synthase/chorismate mutase type II [Lutibacter sp. B1]|uniref:bifunctional 3-deoxy-7-phosphoheptulonate synthase/chorismate mutase type II n=1 Tax=Lutibacter sp. B1 TaxID=2725996 RepID=UPI001456BCC0|nr:bifunctional 3-deoxy-7-phosphoheptulonate synthase/chorismate mutase type II [Lutibacter sp. B1]NLP58844.1 bifunctional 3-deoxy-7-phosphoheptulonate synthase/chorismate mutase type II [Lutibacter sp. B1]
MEITKENRKWLDGMNLSHPIVIAGPCSAETEEQVLKTAHLLKDTDTNVFRAGIWKPRTRPGGFEGVGEKGLPWLQKVKQETGMLITTEVGNTDHVEKALKHGIDILWIGARTTVNPFVVQEIADALKGVDIPVLVKNPVNPDLPLWLGAVERFQAAGISQLGVIHRGFSTYNSLHYRNKPKWHIAIELKKEFPDLPLILDPSHICGRRDTIFDVSQTGLDLNYDGLMIETHIDPDNAWSDAKQQITPARLVEITQELIIRQKNSTKEEFQRKLNMYRKELDLLDSNLIDLLKDRMSISEEIGRLKHKENVAILQSGRWSEILESMIQAGEEKGLNKEFVEEIFKAIHVESINIQHNVK